MSCKINNAVRPENTVRTVVAGEEQQILEQLQARASKKQSGVTLPMIFFIF
jgi:hypothetical protein